MDRLRMVMTVFVVYLIFVFWLYQNGSVRPFLGEEQRKHLLNIDESLAKNISLLRYRVAPSEWIKFFPNLQKSVSTFIRMQKMPSVDSTTSPKFTIVTLSNMSSFHMQKGGTLSAIIQARDQKNYTKTYGGDFFRAILYNDMRSLSGVSCEIKDLFDGNYIVNCPLLWEGHARLAVWLIHPSESLIALMLITSGSREIGVTLKSTVNNSITRRQELVQCGFDLLDVASPENICDHTDPKSGDPWFCMKTTSEECPPIEWMDRYYWDPMYFQILGNRTLFKRNLNWRVLIRSSLKISVEILGAFENSSKPTGQTHEDDRMGQCGPESYKQISSDPATASGWFESGLYWSSLACENSKFSETDLQACLQNHVLYLLGDSTVRQWYRFMIKYLDGSDQGTDGPDIWAQARNGYVAKSNTTIYYRAHGPPLHNPGSPKMRPYITNTLLSIPDNSRNTVVVFTIGLHMDLFHPDLYLQRIRRIRNEALNLRIRAPQVQIFVKGHHVHAQSTRLCPSDWLSYRHDVLLRQTFKNIPGVVYLPYWDMTSVHDNKPYHPKETMLYVQIGLFQSILCSTRTKV